MNSRASLENLTFRMDLLAWQDYWSIEATYVLNREFKAIAYEMLVEMKNIPAFFRTFEDDKRLRRKVFGALDSWIAGIQSSLLDRMAEDLQVICESSSSPSSDDSQSGPRFKMELSETKAVESIRLTFANKKFVHLEFEELNRFVKMNERAMLEEIFLHIETSAREVLKA